MGKKENQTAVQQVFSELQELQPGLFNIYSEDGRNFINHFHKFLAIEKHQIMKAYDMGNQNQYDKINIKDYLNVNEEEYYKETYK
jgi:hypothetical protein